MSNEDIITALKNAIDHGDTLESAKQVLINSGYIPAEVEEASQFIGGGVITTQQITPQEQLTMPTQKKSLVSKLKFWGKKEQSKGKLKPQETAGVLGTPVVAAVQPPQTIQQPTAIPVQPLQRQSVSPQQIKQEIISQQAVPGTISQVNQQLQIPQMTVPKLGQPLQKQLKQITPKKPGHMKEISLLVALLVLIGILVTTIILKDTILGWFS